MKEKKFNYIHIIIAIIVTAFLVYVFMPKNSIEITDYNENIKELYEKIEEQDNTISCLEDKIENIKTDTEDIIGYVDAIYEKMFPNSQEHTLIINDDE